MGLEQYNNKEKSALVLSALVKYHRALPEKQASGLGGKEEVRQIDDLVNLLQREEFTEEKEQYLIEKYAQGFDWGNMWGKAQQGFTDLVSNPKFQRIGTNFALSAAPGVAYGLMKDKSIWDTMKYGLGTGAIGAGVGELAGGMDYAGRLQGLFGGKQQKKDTGGGTEDIPAPMPGEKKKPQPEPQVKVDPADVKKYQQSAKKYHDERVKKEIAERKKNLLNEPKVKIDPAEVSKQQEAAAQYHEQRIQQEAAQKRQQMEEESLRRQQQQAEEEARRIKSDQNYWEQIEKSKSSDPTAVLNFDQQDIEDIKNLSAMPHEERKQWIEQRKQEIIDQASKEVDYPSVVGQAIEGRTGPLTDKDRLAIQGEIINASPEARNKIRKLIEMEDYATRLRREFENRYTGSTPLGTMGKAPLEYLKGNWWDYYMNPDEYERRQRMTAQEYEKMLEEMMNK